MRHGIRMAGVTAALAATVVVGGMGASASASMGKSIGTPPESSTATPSGYKVVVSTFLTATNGVQTHGTVACPVTRKGVQRQPQSGGVVITSNSLAAAINSSYPSGSGWAVDVNNNSGADTTFRVYAVCAVPKTGYTVVQTAGVANPAGSQNRGTVACPAHTKVLGGGSFSNSPDVNANINSSIPSNNGWLVDMDNASGSDATFNVYAICSKYSSNTPPGYTVITGSAVDNPNGSETFATALCPTGEVPLGGGGYSTSGSVAVDMNSSVPSGSEWAVYENNNSGADASITAYAICAS